MELNFEDKKKAISQIHINMKKIYLQVCSLCVFVHAWKGGILYLNLLQLLVYLLYCELIAILSDLL